MQINLTNIDRLVEAAGGARDFWEGIVREGWKNGPFENLAKTAAESFAQSEQQSSTGSRLFKVTKIDEDAARVAVHPVVSAALRSDEALFKSYYFEKANPVKDYELASNARNVIGLAPKSLESDRETANFLVRLPLGRDLQLTGEVASVENRHLGGTTPGYLNGRFAYEQLVRRYSLDPDKLAEIPFESSQRHTFSSAELRSIEKTLELERNSLAYEARGLVSHERLAPHATPGWQWKSERLPLSAESDAAASASVAEEAASPEYRAVQERYQLYGPSMFAKASGWRSEAASEKQDFKFHLIARNARELREIQDSTLPELTGEPGYRLLLRDWKTLQPLFRNEPGAFTGQLAKSFTLYPAAMESSPSLAARLQQRLSNLPARQRPADLTGRPLFEGSPLLFSREQYPVSEVDALRGHVALFDKELSEAIHSDPQLGPFIDNDRLSTRGLRFLEELVGAHPNELAYSADGKLGSGRILKTPVDGKAYLDEGVAFRRGKHYLSRSNFEEPLSELITSEGYSGRWALHIVGARYGHDPLLSLFR